VPGSHAGDVLDEAGALTPGGGGRPAADARVRGAQPPSQAAVLDAMRC
jgi:hypothetical protein